MTFFYDLNKKLDTIREKPETTHKQLNERDLKSASTSALKAAAGKNTEADKKSGIPANYSTKQVKDELKKRGVEEDMSRAAKGYEKYGKEGMEALAKAGREGKSLDPIRARYNKYKDSVEEGSTGDYSATKARAGKDIGKPGKNFSKIAKGAAERYGSKAAGERVAGAVLNKLRHPKESMGMADEGNEFSGELAKAKAQHRDQFSVDGKTYPVKEAGIGDVTKKVGSAVKKVGGAVLNKLGHGSDEDMRKDLQRKMGVSPTGKKPNFADRIAGAKKEVDEMLGDVAAEAIKGALSPKQKKIDMNKNGKLDANDFAMLRKGGKQETDEGWDEMEKDVKSRMSARKVGDVTHGAKHDTQEIPGGRRVTRRTDPNTGYSVGADSDEPASGEKRGRGRPKGPAKAPERVTAKATKHKGGRKTNEGDLEITDRGEYDQEGDMAKDSIKTVVRHAQALEKILGDNDNLPEWVQSKLAKIESMMTAVDDYMQNQEDDEMAMGEEKTSTRDNRAERAGRKVTKDIEYDEKKKDGIHGKKRGSEDDRAEKAGKKVAKDIEYDEKKDKPKKVKEQGGTDTPTASSGFSYGQGIYDSMNRELEGMISESMNISMSMNTDANGGPSKSITINATDDDALKLGELLKNAGLGGGHDMGDTSSEEDIADQIRQAIDGDHGHADDEVCDACGQEDCGCETVDEAYGDDVVDQNSPDFPSNTEYNNDALQYSGGLNKPKSTGQTTIPVIASQDERQKGYGDGFDEDSLSRLREMAGIREAKKDVEEEKTEEGNLFTGNLAKARADGKKEADLDGDGDMEKVKESIRDLTRRWNQFKG